MVSTKVMSPAVAAPLCHSSNAVPRIAVCMATIITPCTPPLKVPRRQVRRVRLRHLPTTLAISPSSRASAPKALTTLLQLTASASAPPTLVSQALERVAAGATKPTDSQTVTEI